MVCAIINLRLTWIIVVLLVGRTAAARGFIRSLLQDIDPRFWLQKGFQPIHIDDEGNDLLSKALDSALQKLNAMRGTLKSSVEQNGQTNSNATSRVKVSEKVIALSNVPSHKSHGIEDPIPDQFPSLANTTLNEGLDPYVCNITAIDLEIVIFLGTRMKTWLSADISAFQKGLNHGFLDTFRSVRAGYGTYGWTNPSHDSASTLENCGSMIRPLSETGISDFTTVASEYLQATDDGSSSPQTDTPWDNLFAGWQIAFSPENPFGFSPGNNPSTAKIVAVISELSVPWSTWMEGVYHVNRTGLLQRPFFKNSSKCAEPQMDVSQLHLAFTEEHHVAQLVMEIFGNYPVDDVTPTDGTICPTPWCHLGVPTSRYLANYMSPMPGSPTIVNFRDDPDYNEEQALSLYRGVQNSVCSVVAWWAAQKVENERIIQWANTSKHHYDPTFAPPYSPVTWPVVTLEDISTAPEDLTTLPESTLAEEVTSSAEGVTTQPEDITTLPEEVSTLLEEVTTQPEAVTTLFEGVSTLPEEMTTQPENVTTQRESVTTQPENVTTQPENVTTQPEEVTTQPEEVTTQPEEMTTEPEEVTTQPDEMTTEAREVTTQPEEITTLPEAATNSLERMSTSPEEMTVSGEEAASLTASFEEFTTSFEGVSQFSGATALEVTTSGQEETSSVPEHETTLPEVLRTSHEEITATPENVSFTENLSTMIVTVLEEKTVMTLESGSSPSGETVTLSETEFIEAKSNAIFEYTSRDHESSSVNDVRTVFESSPSERTVMTGSDISKAETSELATETETSEILGSFSTGKQGSQSTETESDFHTVTTGITNPPTANTLTGATATLIQSTSNTDTQGSPTGSTVTVTQRTDNTGTPTGLTQTVPQPTGDTGTAILSTGSMETDTPTSATNTASTPQPLTQTATNTLSPLPTSSGSTGSQTGAGGGNGDDGNNWWIAGVVTGGLSGLILCGCGTYQCCFVGFRRSEDSYENQRDDDHNEVFEGMFEDQVNEWTDPVVAAGTLRDELLLPAGMYLAKHRDNRRSSMEGFMEGIDGYTLIKRNEGGAETDARHMDGVYTIFD